MSSGDEILTLSTLRGFEERIRAGDSTSVRKELERIFKDPSHERRLKRSQRRLIASYWRRSGGYLRAVRLLHPVVHPQSRRRERLAAEPAEIVEYAASLNEIGASLESLRLLKSVSPREEPRTDLFRAFALFNLRRHEEAVIPLRRYLDSPGLDPYAALIGRVNLIAAHVQSDTSPSGIDDSLDRLIEETSRDARHLGADLLLGNLFELQGQREIRRRDPSRGRHLLEEARIRLENSAGFDAHYLKAWSTISDVLEAPQAEATRSRVLELRQEALRIGQYETLRDLDLFQGTALRDESLLLRAYFGTPFRSYRRFILRQSDWTPPEHKIFFLQDENWTSLPPSRESPILFRPETGLDSSPLRWGGDLQLLFAKLSSDFYRPFRVTELHEAIHLDSFFHPESSPLALRQTMKRLRQWIPASSCLEIRASARGYRWAASLRPEPFHFSAEPSPRPEEPEFERFRRRIMNLESFSIAELEKLELYPRRTLQRWISEWTQEGWLVAEGKARSRRYRLKAQSAKNDVRDR